MDWHELYPADREPAWEDIAGYLESPLWSAFCAHLDEVYGAVLRRDYSRCGMEPGWNIKARKGSRALCTVYPRPGHFCCMISIGAKQEVEAELLLPALSEYTRALYARTTSSPMGRWLMIEVTDESALHDVYELLALRAPAKRKGARHGV